jgi:hypothetical protein
MVSPSLLVGKLSGYPRQNHLFVALREIGRIERFSVHRRMVTRSELRRRVPIGLNKAEEHHTLRRAIRFYRRGSVSIVPSWIRTSTRWPSIIRDGGVGLCHGYPPLLVKKSAILVTTNAGIRQARNGVSLDTARTVTVSDFIARGRARQPDISEGYIHRANAAPAAQKTAERRELALRNQIRWRQSPGVQNRQQGPPAVAQRLRVTGKRPGPQR